ncbi:GNAT family N-acetyltransferase [Ponticoccus sp. SC2-23]|uniref:GNAT family N-acetyltransferase n=1 Tax=Alexandriicola marinus TaxID=2081710 RepID=UPI000FDAE5B2|nr:GNAT family N-acyltransferase [Alexandriicola marinus]MBM1219110.1 GNAT family N-acetyltransferase [Ponticoccus sp. SC6-9]MBM1223818.1 GNAT family N-acetyltransferase [Ponticoccus sp. SC6-15]MBM1228924.1 GNAT family N-acetyltransferase [Ponticoccus sp. SC6-38]MBM1232784.1 GNAT family N-acetyltransferase [Ponticoccus sp. SC6-45]MBM1237266.1 GNAT family N-acetyltransferase [Ponticoccus sp. SC6-49]MBM1241795.1 GNAT family N-acetyltransferase [Ponticoccus sp. SC2-64]MBM1246308.1 GNAT family N
MTEHLEKGRYRARWANTAAEIEAAMRLRHLCFMASGGGQGRDDGLDRDDFDDRCRHLLIEEIDGGRLVGCCRLMLLRDGTEIGSSYSAQYYELSRLSGYGAPMLELGRFCIHPGILDPDILRMAWAALTRLVDAEGVELIFGCSSFAGTETDRYLDAFGLLSDRHVAPRRWLPRVKAPRVFRFAETLRRAHHETDRKSGLQRMPPLLRSYLAMGGWVSDHAVVDTDLNTLHVFTGLEIRSIPEARARALRLVAT